MLYIFASAEYVEGQLAADISQMIDIYQLLFWPVVGMTVILQAFSQDVQLEKVGSRADLLLL